MYDECAAEGMSKPAAGSTGPVTSD